MKNLTPFISPKDKAGIVYRIKNLAENKIYIGSTVCPFSRFKSHRSNLKCGTHENKRLQRDYTILGADFFDFDILFEYKSRRPNSWGGIRIKEYGMIQTMKPYYNVSRNEVADKEYRKQLTIYRRLLIATADDIAKKAGVNRSTVHAIFRGQYQDERVFKVLERESAKILQPVKHLFA
jgi:group I intron endonuclease